VNVDQQMRSNLDASVSAFYGRSTNVVPPKALVGRFSV